MLATLIIVFREVLEAGLVVGIVLAASRGVPGRGLWVTGGCTAGVLREPDRQCRRRDWAGAFQRGHPVRGSLHARLAQYLDEPARP
jgi:hypothetical protein